MNNKFMDYLITTEYDKEKNYTIIMNRINEKRKPYYIKTIAASVLFFIIAGLLGNGIYAKIQWNIQYKEYLNVDRGVTSLSVKESETSGNLVKIDDQYLFDENVGDFLLKFYARQIINAMETLDQNNFIHFDIKLQCLYLILIV